MKIRDALLIGLTLMLGGCLYNPTIDQEIADKCGISLNDYQRAEAALDEASEGMSLRSGRCRLTRTSDGETEGIVTD